jgi:hypothetical protein
MAQLATADPDLLRIDFHSHTNGSSDARRGFSVEANRAWHRAGGYDVAFVTDHGTTTEALKGVARNPPPGTDGVILLTGIEASWKGEHVGVLGAHRDGPLHPVLIWNHPRDGQLKDLPIASREAADGVRAIEISNGSPRGMDLIRLKRSQIVALARQQDLALTSGTDNHGWGRAAPNWTLLRLDGWRRLDREELTKQIDHAIGQGGFAATRVVERTMADPGKSAVALAFTAGIVPWRLLTTLSMEERLVWLVWIWVIASIAALRRRHA